MKHLELHILQSVPVSCLNRDDLGSPKTAVFGGVQRARVSSQCWKRAIRELAKEIAPEKFQGKRTRLLYEPLRKSMIEADLSEREAEEGARSIVDYLVKIDAKSRETVKSKTLYFMSPLEFETVAKAYAQEEGIKEEVKKMYSNSLKGAAKKRLKDKINNKLKGMLKKIDAKSRNDAADISLFGRMVASDHSLTIEAASMFSHALSTHKADNEIDFFAAVDDLQPKGELGAGMTGTLEFTSATYYRFAALNLDMLADEQHLGSLDREERQNIVKSFVEAVISSMPGAHKYSMNSNTPPSFVLGVVREKGHPIQLVNAFEEPVPRSNKGYMAESIERLKKEYNNLKKTWVANAIFEQSSPTVSPEDFLEGVVEHVV